jgi:hypothetical protein
VHDTAVADRRPGVGDDRLLAGQSGPDLEVRAAIARDLDRHVGRHAANRGQAEQRHDHERVRPPQRDPD